MPLDLPPYLLVPQKPAIIRASRMPESPADVRGIKTHPVLGLGGSFAAHLMAGGGAVAKSLTFIDSYPISDDLTTYNFSVDVGAGHSSLRLILGGGNGSSVAFSSGTADGVGLAIVSDGTTSAAQSGGSGRAFIVIAHLPSSSGSIAVSITLAGASVQFGACAWTAEGLTSNTAVDVDSSTADPGVATISTVADGFAVACGWNNSAAGTNTWSGTDVTSRFVDAVEGNTRFTAADAPTTGANLSPSINWAGTNTNRVMVTASF